MFGGNWINGLSDICNESLTAVLGSSEMREVEAGCQWNAIRSGQRLVNKLTPGLMPSEKENAEPGWSESKNLNSRFGATSLATFFQHDKELGLDMG
jgi:hypothetical protein